MFHLHPEISVSGITSPRESHIRVSVDKETEVKHVPDVLIIEHQNPLKEDHVCGIDHGCLRQPAEECHITVQKALFYLFKTFSMPPFYPIRVPQGSPPKKGTVLNVQLNL